MPEERQTGNAKKGVKYVGQVTRPFRDASVIRVLAPQNETLKSATIDPIHLRQEKVKGQIKSEQESNKSYLVYINQHSNIIRSARFPFVVDLELRGMWQVENGNTGVPV